MLIHAGRGLPPGLGAELADVAEPPPRGEPDPRARRDRRSGLDRRASRTACRTSSSTPRLRSPLDLLSLLAKVGPEQVLFASDMPYGDQFYYQFFCLGALRHGGLRRRSDPRGASAATANRLIARRAARGASRRRARRPTITLELDRMRISSYLAAVIPLLFARWSRRDRPAGTRGVLLPRARGSRGGARADRLDRARLGRARRPRSARAPARETRKLFRRDRPRPGADRLWLSSTSGVAAAQRRAADGACRGDHEPGRAHPRTGRSDAARRSPAARAPAAPAPCSSTAMPSLSCILLAAQAEGASVRTVEGLAGDGELSPLQRPSWRRTPSSAASARPGSSPRRPRCSSATPPRRASRGAPCDGRQPLPLRRIRQDRARRAARRRRSRASGEARARRRSRWRAASRSAGCSSSPTITSSAWPDSSELARRRPRRAARHGAQARLGRRALHLGHRAARHARGRRPALAPRPRARRARPRGRPRGPGRARGRRPRRDAAARGRGRADAPSPTTRAQPWPRSQRPMRDAAARGLAALAPRWEPLGFVVDLEQGLAEQRFTEDPSRDERGDVEAGFAEADVIVEAEYRTPAQVQQALEPHCAVADWSQDELSIWVSTQGIFDARGQLAESFGARPRSRARDLRVHGRRLRRQAGRHASRACSPRTSRASRAVPCGCSTTAAPRRSRPGIAPATIQSYRVGRPARRHADRDRGDGRDRDGRERPVRAAGAVSRGDALPLRERAHRDVPRAAQPRLLERLPRARA